MALCSPFCMPSLRPSQNNMHDRLFREPYVLHLGLQMRLIMRISQFDSGFQGINSPPRASDVPTQPPHGVPGILQCGSPPPTTINPRIAITPPSTSIPHPPLLVPSIFSRQAQLSHHLLHRWVPNLRLTLLRQRPLSHPLAHLVGSRAREHAQVCRRPCPRYHYMH